MTTLSKEDVVRTDNDLLAMIQKHFPSLPLDDRYTDWGKWLRFAKAVYSHGEQAARADLVAENERLRGHFVEERNRTLSLCNEVAQLIDQTTATRTALAAAEADNERLHIALVDSISWHDDSGRYLPAFNCIEEASSIYGFSYKSDMSALREMIAGVYEECAKVCDLFEQKADALNDSIADDDGANEGRSEYIMGKATASSRIAKAIRALAEKAKGE